MFPNFMKKLADWKIYEFFPKKTIDFFTDFIEVTINRRKNKEQVYFIKFQKREYMLP